MTEKNILTTLMDFYWEIIGSYRMKMKIVAWVVNDHKE